MLRAGLLASCALLALGGWIHHADRADAQAQVGVFASMLLQSSRLPDHPDAALVQRACASCHGLELITTQRYTRDGWAAVVDDMVVRGAQGSDDELERITDYLATHFGTGEDAGGRASVSEVHEPEPTPETASAQVTPSEADSPSRAEGADWVQIGRDAGGTRFSPLAQITTENVDRLTTAWTYELATRGGQVEATGTAARPRMSQQTPLAVDGILYITSPYGAVAAIEAHTGSEIWWRSLGPEQGLPTLRSLAYWPGDDESRPALFFGTTTGLLLALDAQTGEPVESFGEGGAVNLRTGVADNFPNANYSMTSAPVIVGDVIVTGSRTQEQPATGPSGAVRGWDVRTGAVVWTFNTIPQPGEAHHETWEGDSWRDRSGANAWGLMTADVEAGTVFVPLGSATYDYYGGDRPGANLYANAVVALDAASGAVKWHYQIVHHDVWDYDLNAAPVLVDVERDGETIPAVAQITKQSLLFVLNRETGEPVHAVEERAVPQDGFTEGEHPWPTQPHPVITPPLSRADFSPEEIARITPEHTQFCETMLRTGRPEAPPVGEGGLKTGPLYSSYDEGGTIMFPGTLGGVNWHGMTYDPERSLLIGATMSLGEVYQMAPDEEVGDPGYRAHRYQFWDAERWWPCNAPPWGELVAVDMNSGEVAWRRPLGSYPELEALGIEDAGTPVLGAAITTGGGLTFIGGTLDNRFRAFASETGEELWNVDVGAASHNIPSTFVGRDGHQYVAVIVSGGGYMRDPIISPVLIAYRLADEEAATD